MNCFRGSLTPNMPKMLKLSFKYDCFDGDFPKSLTTLTETKTIFIDFVVQIITHFVVNVFLVL